MNVEHLVLRPGSLVRGEGLLVALDEGGWPDDGPRRRRVR